MAEKHTVFLLLGSNIQPRLDYIENAVRLINKSLGEITRFSSVYESEPWGFEAPVAFLNQVVCVDTTFGPLELLKKTREIEQKNGRTSKSVKGNYTSRSLDIDILFFDDEIIHLPELTIPHTHIADRRFTLFPLTEIAPEKIHPVLKRNCRQLLAECRDKGKVWKYEREQINAL